MHRPLPSRLHAASLMAMATLVLPAAAQKKPAIETRVWIDAATHDAAGMPGLGSAGGFGGRLMGMLKGSQEYPQSRDIPSGTGRFLDIAMHNSRMPGTVANQQVPAGLGIGESLLLLPPSPDKPGKSDRGTPPKGQDEMEITVRQYWGCDAKVRPGQPRIIKMKASAGVVDVRGQLAPGLFVPDRDIDAGPAYALWPNRKSSKRVPDQSSLVGGHRITGSGVPESLHFELGKNADFLPKILLSSHGELTDSIALEWQPVERSRAYFLHAVAMQDEHSIVVWSSAEIAGASHELLNYLGGPDIDKWLKQKVLLPATKTRCEVPKGIFQPQGANRQGVAALNMIAYGPETNITWPPKPADARQSWDPEWNVRIRTKSTATAMLGIRFTGAAERPDQDGGKPQPATPGKGKRLLDAFKHF